jgi:hypothetical protein
VPTPRPRRRAVVKTYTPEALLASPLGEFITQPEPTGDGEQPMFCPRCEEPGRSRTASASINGAKGKWHCLGKCGDGGKISALAQDLGFSIRGSIRSAVPARPSLPAPLENQDSPLDWHDALMLRHPERLAYLTDVRGLDLATLAANRIGFDGERFTVPIGPPGKVRNVRRYSPTRRPKMLNTPGHGSPSMLAFTRGLAGNTLPVILAAGEWDALLTGQECAGVAVAVTGTGGEASPPRDLSALAAREVFVAYDCDAAGVAGAEKVASRLRDLGARVHVLDLTRLGLPYSETHGADLGDFFLRYGGTAGKLAAEMERLRSSDQETEDTLVAEIADLMVQSDETQIQDFMPQMLTDEEIGELDPPEWAVHGWALVDNYTSIYGEPGVMKTFAILDLLRSVRAGVPWLGNPTRRGATMLFEGEGLTQLQPRIAAWNAHQELTMSDLAPGLSGAPAIDMSTPEGVARVVRTVRAAEAQWGEPVSVIGFDPAVEFMPNEDVETMDLLTRGVRALARYLHIAVVIGHHSNAAGDRERGGLQMRMRAGVHVRMERIDLERGVVGVVQEKNRFAAPLALEVAPLEVADSLVLALEARMSRAEYAAARENATRTANATRQRARVREFVVSNLSEAEAAVVEVLTGSPWLSGRKVRAAVTGHGTDTVQKALAALAAEGRVVTRPAARGATEYALADEVSA